MKLEYIKKDIEKQTVQSLSQEGAIEGNMSIQELKTLFEISVDSEDDFVILNHCRMHYIILQEICNELRG